MKNLKKIVALVLALVMVCAMTVVVTHALEDDERVIRNHCPRCTDGYLSESSSTSEGVEYKSCSHGTGGKDAYYVVRETVTETCNSCSYNATYTHVVSSDYLYCTGE